LKPATILQPNVNHKYRTFTITQMVQSATDDCDGNVINNVVIEKATSDEPDGGDGTLNDIVIASGCKSVQLRAERDGTKDGRVYHITLGVKDSSANPTTAVYNVSKGGSSVPIKFSLHGNQGMSIFAQGYPLSQQILATGSYTDSTITVTTNASGLQYDASSDQYTYVWNTSKAWSGENRQLVLELSDGVTYIRANFYLK